MFKDKEVFLFDLDGTLLNIEVDEFLKYYFGALSEKFSDLCDSKEEFIGLLTASTEKMIRNDGSRSNQEAFMDDFMEKLNVEEEDEAQKIKGRFDNFYQTDFRELAKYFKLDKETPAEIIKYLKSKGKKLVLATNPLFPVEAVEARLEWVNIDPTDFALITNYENMSYAKPNPEYYQEILEKIEESPDNCLMIGNDLKEDAVASRLGIETMIVEDKLIEREDSSFDIAWQGTLKELKELIKKEI
ncbi:MULTISPECIES: HAD family hydrolase [Halanaerobium]|uniref:HAD superfamily hydrolase (TIGR01549 family) n=1 Tax=Halanaerobium saccharolyticum TaxID=43595 RepID=A0A4R6RWX2_9FIRM|nr:MULTISPECIES: HAD family hydrolase [Halanaerobium]KXS50417.1 MAG: haloacid dehalogenase domain-containing protein hydrolase [Halanaerobium sp. T82-1]RCW62305.1 HAD superfamily hydrolase (TIGR01549 family) [Halanaerobium sp. ST460_2HS_T2]TDP91314.1 HAD superfamily hydrolase (TIGR01549 family) [Halanaerobium saccharolyticum]